METVTRRTTRIANVASRPAMEEGKYNESWSLAEHPAQTGTQDQSTPVSGDGLALYAASGPPAAPEAGAVEQSLPRDGGDGGGGGGGGGREPRNRDSDRRG